MRRSICVLLACVLLLSVPAVAVALTQTDSALTFYSNVPGWSLLLTNTYAKSTTTQWKVTGVSLRAHLNEESVYLGPVEFRNTSGSLGPMYVKLYSEKALVYSNQCSVTHNMSPGSTSTHSWVPNKLTRMTKTYGTGKVYWTQNVNRPIAPGSSSQNPETLSTDTY
jgi:hypothetical protein